MFLKAPLKSLSCYAASLSLALLVGAPAIAGTPYYATYLEPTNVEAPGHTKQGGVKSGANQSWGGVYNLTAFSMSTSKGGVGTQGLGATTYKESPSDKELDTDEGYNQILELNRCDQYDPEEGECVNGTVDDHTSVFKFKLPPGQAPGNLTGLKLRTNIMSDDYDTWQFRIRDFNSGEWKRLGSVTGDWSWKSKSWSTPSSNYAGYVNDANEVHVQVRTTTQESSEAGNLDYLALKTTFPIIDNARTDDSDISAIKVWDQQDADYDTNHSIRLMSSDATYEGDYKFTLATSKIPKSKVKNVAVEANLKSHIEKEQRWDFNIWDYSASSWTVIGNNKYAANNNWTPYYFVVSGSKRKFIDDNGNIKVQIKSENTYGDAELDFLSVKVTYRRGSKPSDITTWRVPRPLDSWYWQLSEGSTGVQPLTSDVVENMDWYNTDDVLINPNLDKAAGKDIVELDLLLTPTWAMEEIRNDGASLMCYFSTQFEANRKLDRDAFLNADGSVKSNASDALGGCIRMDDQGGEKSSNCWPGNSDAVNWERWVNPSTPAVLTLLTKRLDIAVERGCDGIEPDNIDAYAQPYNAGDSSNKLPGQSGFTKPTQEQQKDLNLFLVHEAHKRGLYIAFKNSTQDISSFSATDQSRYFDLAVNEECRKYKECAVYEPFTDQGKAVLNAEYNGRKRKVCDYFDDLMPDVKISGTRRDLHLTDSTVNNCQ